MPDSAAALSVLVLAWDEAAPTVRTVVEAAPALGSLLVLLPPMPAATPARPGPRPPAAPIVAAAPPAPVAAPTPPTVVAAPAPQPRPTAVGVLAPAEVAAAAPPLAPAAPSIRRRHLVASQLPATMRSGSFRVPAAPYLGATPAGSPPTPPTLVTAANQLVVPEALPEAGTPQPVAAPLPSGEPAAPSPTAAPAPALPEAAAPAALPAALALPLAKAAFSADEILDSNPEDELAPSLPTSPAATPADTPRLADTAPSSAFSALGPFGNRLPQFDTSPPLPPAPAPAAPDPDDTPEERAATFAATVAAAQQYPAPDLNSQVIRYARLALPTALAEGQFGVIYAPAWPTWLAAIELRQRTTCPLVLHLPALAAGRQPADTAAGWPAEIQRQALRQADLVLVETYALARRLRRELGLDSGAVRVVAGADTAAIARALHRARRRSSAA